MFDTTIVRQAPAYPQHVHVTERRAPTDESVRLLSEMETAARERVMATGRLANNTLTCEWWVLRDPAGPGAVCTFKLLLNGRLIQRSFRLPDDLNDDPLTTTVTLVHAKVIEALAAEVTVGMFTGR